MRSIATAIIPARATVAISSISRFVIVLSFVVRQTIGRLMTALAKEASTAALPADDGLSWPCTAIVAAAAVVLALLTSPPIMATANIPEVPNNLVSSAQQSESQ